MKIGINSWITIGQNVYEYKIKHHLLIDSPNEKKKKKKEKKISH